ncbi:olfactory receptor 52K1-like [Dasypus novemcinctus]|uniref:olfactory receptor 52K1-like n=1 Tax=Dasypus novemcinctus TaxID=9361 RepID=UPI0039C9B383
MFLFLCMLSVTDLVLSTSTLPRMLCLFCLGAHDIAFDACLAQMFFIHSFTIMESGFFLTMAIDHYVAICHPLHHTTILTHTRIVILGIIVVVRGVGFYSPHPILLKQLSYCRTRVIAHTYCEFMAVVKLACTDTRATKHYSLCVSSIIGSCDAISTAISYAFILRSVFQLPSEKLALRLWAHVPLMFVSFLSSTPQLSFPCSLTVLGKMCLHISIFLLQIHTF